MSAATIGSDAITLVAGAVTALFVPGDRPDRYAKATAAGADVVIIDLEDAVAPPAKFRARLAATHALAPTTDTPINALVRVNAAGTDTHDAEITELAGLAGIAGSGLLGVVLPKAEDPAMVADVVGRLRATGTRLAVVALLESAVGVLRAAEIARVPGVTRLALGAIDLTADVDADLDSPVVTHAMAHLVLASRAARIAPPLDSPATAITDTTAVATAARLARATGFGGKLCIHPAQLAPTRTAFLPTDDQIAWATTVIATTNTAGQVAVQVDGQMIDTPLIAKARTILRRAGQAAS